MNCGLNRRFSSNTRLALINSMPVTLPSRPMMRLGPNRVWSRMPSLLGLLDFLPGGRDFVEVLQAIHVDLRHAFADRLAGHVQRQPHFVRRLGVLRVSSSSAEAA